MDVDNTETELADRPQPDGAGVPARAAAAAPTPASRERLKPGDTVDVDRKFAVGDGGRGTIVSEDEYGMFVIKPAGGGPQEKGVPAHALTRIDAPMAQEDRRRVTRGRGPGAASLETDAAAAAAAEEAHAAEEAEAKAREQAERVAREQAEKAAAEKEAAAKAVAEAKAREEAEKAQRTDLLSRWQALGGGGTDLPWAQTMELDLLSAAVMAAEAKKAE